MITAKELKAYKKNNEEQYHKSMLTSVEQSLDYLVKHNMPAKLGPHAINAFEELAPKYEGIVFHLKHVVPNWFNREWRDQLEHYEVTFEIVE